jgi:hypothetical protein
MSDIASGIASKAPFPRCFRARYEGEWKDGLRHGKGTWTSHNGNEVYVGDFQNGFREGYGSLVNKEVRLVLHVPIRRRCERMF